MPFARSNIALCFNGDFLFSLFCLHLLIGILCKKGLSLVPYLFIYSIVEYRIGLQIYKILKEEDGNTKLT